MCVLDQSGDTNPICIVQRPLCNAVVFILAYFQVIPNKASRTMILLPKWTAPMSVCLNETAYPTPFVTMVIYKVTYIHEQSPLFFALQWESDCPYLIHCRLVHLWRVKMADAQLVCHKKRSSEKDIVQIWMLAGTHIKTKFMGISIVAYFCPQTQDSTTGNEFDFRQCLAPNLLLGSL